MKEEISGDRTRIENIQEERAEILSRFDDIFEAWECKSVKKLDAKAYAEWIGERNWKILITLTFEFDVADDVAEKKFYWLVRELNREVFGNHYSRYVGHSYFSYILGIEYQVREVIHFHVLIDRQVHFQSIHKFWNEWAGYAWAEEILNTDHAVKYVTKYVSKGGRIIPFFANIDIQPMFPPLWWVNESKQDQD